MSAATAPVETVLRPTAQGGQVGVHVPRQWRDRLSAPMYAQLVALLSVRSARQMHVAVGQRAIARRLGRREDSRTDQVGRVTEQLVDAGVVTTSRTQRNTGITRYAFCDLSGRYDVISWPLLHAVAAGECSPNMLRTYAFLEQAMGNRGWTSDTAAEIADRAGVSADTITSHVNALEAVGVIRARRTAGVSGWSFIERVDERRAVPGRVARPQGESDVVDLEQVRAARSDSHRSAADGVGPRTDSDAVETAGVPELAPPRASVEHDSVATAVTPQDVVMPDESSLPVLSTSVPSAAPARKNVGSARKNVGSIRELTPVELTPEDTPGWLVLDRQVSKRATRATDDETSKAGVFAGPEVAQVLTGLTGTAWRSPEHKRWLGGVLGQAVRPALESGMSPQAIVWALRTHGEDSLLERPDAHVPIARAAIAEVRTDIRLGQACRRCGRLDDTGELVDGEHATCPTGDIDRHEEDQAVLPVAERLAACQGLGMTLAEIEQIDPEAAGLARQQQIGIEDVAAAAGAPLAPETDVAEAASPQQARRTGGHLARRARAPRRPGPGHLSEVSLSPAARRARRGGPRGGPAPRSRATRASTPSRPAPGAMEAIR